MCIRVSQIDFYFLFSFWWGNKAHIEVAPNSSKDCSLVDKGKLNMETKIRPCSSAVMNPWALTPFEITMSRWALADPPRHIPQAAWLLCSHVPLPGSRPNLTFRCTKKTEVTSHRPRPLPSFVSHIVPVSSPDFVEEALPPPQGSSETLSSLKISDCLLLASPSDPPLCSSICYLRK